MSKSVTINHEIQDKEVVDIILEKYNYRPETIIMILQDVQQHYNYLPKEVLEYVSEKMSIPLMQIYGIATFYKTFSLKPKGKCHICICQGTACHVKGAPLLLERIHSELGIRPGETTPDGEFSLELVRCVGACSLAPVVVVGSDVHGNVTQRKLLKILKEKK